MMKKIVRALPLALIIVLLVVPFNEGAASDGLLWENAIFHETDVAWPATSIPQDLEDYYVFVATPEALTDIAGLNEGSLYKQHITSKETTLLVQGIVNAVRFFDEQIWYAMGNTIYCMDTDGGNSRIVCTYEGEIEYFTPGNRAVLIESDGNLFRISLENAKTNWVCSLTDIISYKPMTINTMYIATEDGEYTVDLTTGHQGEYIKPNDTEEDTGIAPLALSSYTISGVSIPVRRPNVGSNKRIEANKSERTYTSSVFDNGTYFSHNGNSERDPIAPGESLIYPPDSTGCAAFARYVYTEIWGSESDHQHVYSTVKMYNETSIKAYYMSIPAGSSIRLRSAGGTGHSIILLSANSEGIDVYDANWDNAWGVQIKTLSYGTMPDKFYEIAAQRSPGFASGTASGHRACKEVSCPEYNTFSPHYVIGTPGYGTCAACGYTGYISIGTSGLPDEPVVE